MLLFLDYTNLEGYNYVYNTEARAFEGWSNVFFNQNFLLDLGKQFCQLSESAFVTEQISLMESGF